MSKKLAKWLYHFAALPLKAFKNDDIKGLSAKGNWPGNLEKQDKEFSSNGFLLTLFFYEFILNPNDMIFQFAICILKSMYLVMGTASSIYF